LVTATVILSVNGLGFKLAIAVYLGLNRH